VAVAVLAVAVVMVAIVAVAVVVVATVAVAVLAAVGVVRVPPLEEAVLRYRSINSTPRTTCTCRRGRTHCRRVVRPG
jgi:hypothetical protein